MSDAAEVAEDYRHALEDLSSNMRHEISNLTVIARENTEHALTIAEVLQTHILKVGVVSLISSHVCFTDLSRPPQTRNYHLCMCWIRLSRMSARRIPSTLDALSSRPLWNPMRSWTRRFDERWRRCSGHGKKLCLDLWIVDQSFRTN